MINVRLDSNTLIPEDRSVTTRLSCLSSVASEANQEAVNTRLVLVSQGAHENDGKDSWKRNYRTRLSTSWMKQICSSLQKVATLNVLWPTGHLHSTHCSFKKYGSCKYKIYIKNQKINPENSGEWIPIVILCDFHIRFITNKNLYETITQPHTYTFMCAHLLAQYSKSGFVLIQTINILKVN